MRFAAAEAGHAVRRRIMDSDTRDPPPYKACAMKPRKAPAPLHTIRSLVLVDESNVVSSAWASKRSLDWIRLRDFLCDATLGRTLIEMVVYVGLPPVMAVWQNEREKKNKFIHWLRSNGFLVVTKDGSPAEEGHYKSNVDVMMAIDAVELSVAMQPDVVTLVTGDADFAYLALQLRRRGIRVEVASVSGNLGSGLKSSANAVIDLAPLLATFEPLKASDR